MRPFPNSVFNLYERHIVQQIIFISYPDQIYADDMALVGRLKDELSLYEYLF